MTATVVTRTLAATPKELASETWAKIVDLVAPYGAVGAGPAREELRKVAGVVCSCITDESLRDDALTVYGAAPRVRIYCLYGDDALDHELVDDAPLLFTATVGDWRMSVPCREDDLPWVKSALTRVSTRVTARVIGTAVEGGQTREARNSGPRAYAVDVDLFMRG